MPLRVCVMPNDLLPETLLKRRRAQIGAGHPARALALIFTSSE